VWYLVFSYRFGERLKAQSSDPSGDWALAFKLSVTL
jgi:hypothetical protein